MRVVRVLCFLVALSGCENLSRFDTKGSAAYCGTIVGAQFVRTTESKGGFRRDLRLRLQLDTETLSTLPGTLSTDDAAVGPCAPNALFHEAPLRVTPEVVNDALSSLEFEEGQVHNVVAWVDSSCRGPMLSIVSMYKNGHVALRLLKPGTTGIDGTDRDAFALFQMARSDTGCGF